MSIIDELVTNNEAYASRYSVAEPLPPTPSRHLAIVACMDHRMDVYALLGLREGEAHVIRNAGGVITDDEVRSLAISQRLMGTEEIMLIHHTDCPMLGLTEHEFKAEIQRDAGFRPHWAVEAFRDVASDVRHSMRRIKASFYLQHTSVRGFVFDVATGRLTEVKLEPGVSRP
jgi:carbonic anhydrase